MMRIIKSSIAGGMLLAALAFGSPVGAAPAATESAPAISIMDSSEFSAQRWGRGRGGFRRGWGHRRWGGGGWRGRGGGWRRAGFYRGGWYAPPPRFYRPWRPRRWLCPPGYFGPPRFCRPRPFFYY